MGPLRLRPIGPSGRIPDAPLPSRTVPTRALLSRTVSIPVVVAVVSIFGVSRAPKSHAHFVRPSATGGGGGGGAGGARSQPAREPALANPYALPWAAFARERAAPEDGPNDWLLKMHPLTE